MATQGNSLLAAVLSIFIPGLGQLYKGHIIMAIIWFVILVLGYGLSYTHGFPVPVPALLHIVCVVQAYMMG